MAKRRLGIFIIILLWFNMRDDTYVSIFTSYSWSGQMDVRGITDWTFVGERPGHLQLMRPMDKSLPPFWKHFKKSPRATDAVSRREIEEGCMGRKWLNQRWNGFEKAMPNLPRQWRVLLPPIVSAQIGSSYGEESLSVLGVKPRLLQFSGLYHFSSSSVGYGRKAV